MIKWPRRTLTFALFVLTGYLRSWRYLAELLFGIGVVALFLTPKGPFNAPQFFTVIGLFMLVQCAYTTWAIAGLGRRAEGYVILARPLGRSGYLIGYYLASIGMTVILYLVLSLVALAMYWISNQMAGFSQSEWAMGSLPLLMNVAIVSAFAILITPLVVTAWPRLAALALVVVAMTSESNLFANLNAGWIVLRLHELFGVVLLPLGAGFGLAAGGGYTADSMGVLLGQVALTLALLLTALVAFARRELILSS